MASCLPHTGRSHILLGAVPFACAVTARHHFTLYTKQELHSLYTNMSCGRCIMDMLSRLPPTADLSANCHRKADRCLSLGDFTAAEALRKAVGPEKSVLPQKQQHLCPLYYFWELLIHSSCFAEQSKEKRGLNQVQPQLQRSSSGTRQLKVYKGPRVMGLS